MYVGQRIRELRELRSWTVGELAARAGLSQPCVHRIEAGNRQGRFSSLHKIARALDVGLADLIPARDSLDDYRSSNGTIEEQTR